MIKKIEQLITKLEQLIAKLNSKQKLIFAIIIPIALFILTMPIAEEFDHHWESQPFRFEYTWWVWLLYVCVVGFLEYKIFEEKEEKPKAN